MTDATPARAVFYHRVGRSREDTDEECQRQARRVMEWAASNRIQPAPWADVRESEMSDAPVGAGR